MCCVIAEHETFRASIPAKYEADASDSELQLNARRASDSAGGLHGVRIPPAACLKPHTSIRSTRKSAEAESGSLPKVSDRPDEPCSNACVTRGGDVGGTWRRR